MIAKQSKGRGFRGTLNYVLGKEKAQIIGGNMLGENARELASEFAESRKLRPGVSRAVYHVSLSLPIGEKLSDSQWSKVSQQYLEKMGFSKSQYVVARHSDTEHDHIHIVASRIDLDGKCVSESNDFKRSEKVIRSLEIAHGLTRVLSSHELERRAPSRGEIELAQRGIISTKVQLQGLVDAALANQPSMSEFFNRMRATGVQVIPNVAKTGHISGISYVLDNEQMKGSDLGRGYTWLGIQKRGVKYEQERDFKAISLSKEHSTATESNYHDRESESLGRQQSREIKLRDGEASHSYVHHKQGNRSFSQRTQDYRSDTHERSRERHEPSEKGGIRNPELLKQNDSQALGVDAHRGNGSRTRGSDLLRAVASSLRANREAGRRSNKSLQETLRQAPLKQSQVEKFIETIFQPEKNEDPQEKKKNLTPPVPRKGRNRGRSGPDFFGF